MVVASGHRCYVCIVASGHRIEGVASSSLIT